MTSRLLDTMLDTFSTMPLESNKITKNPCKGMNPCTANEDCMTWVKGCRLKSVNVRQVNHMKRSIKKLEDILKNLPQDQEKKLLLDKIKELKLKIEFPPQPVQKGQKGQMGQVTVQNPDEIITLKAQIAAVQANYNILKGNSQAVQLKRSSLEKEYQDLRALHADMVQSNRQQLSNKNEEITTLKAQMETIRLKHANLKGNGQAVQLKRSTLEKEYQDLQALHREMVQLNRQQLSELHQLNINLEKENQALNEQMDELEDRINNYERQIQFLNETNTNSQKNLRKANLEYEELQNQIKFLDEEYQGINNTLLDCRKLKQQTQTQIIQKPKQQQTKIRSNQNVQLKRQLDTVKNEYAELDNQLYEKQVIINQLKASVQKNKEEISRIKALREEDNITYNDLITENDNLRQNLIKFDRLKVLMSRKDNLTDSQLQEFQNIMYSI